MIYEASVVAVTIFFLFVLGLPAGRASDRWGPRPVVLVGAAFQVSGLLATSVVGRIELGYVTYGLGIGLGVACCYVPVVTQVTGWFERRRASALGVALDGPDLIELFVHPSNVEKAKELIMAVMEEEGDEIPGWTCQCGEEVDEGFGVCWSCGAEYKSDSA